MPNKPMKPCHKVGCSNLTSGKYCEEHQHLQYQERKATDNMYKRTRQDTKEQAFYSSTVWRKVRKIKLQQNPLCEICEKEDKIVIGTMVHHKQEIKLSGAKLDIDNLMTLCDACHEKIHRR